MHQGAASLPRPSSRARNDRAVVIAGIHTVNTDVPSDLSIIGGDGFRSIFAAYFLPLLPYLAGCAVDGSTRYIPSRRNSSDSPRHPAFVKVDRFRWMEQVWKRLPKLGNCCTHFSFPLLLGVLGLTHSLDSCLG